MITPEAIASNFPSLTGRCYLNTAAECIPPLVTGEALREYWDHKLLGMDGRDFHFARENEARENAARLLGLSPAEVGFCSCSAEAFNLLATALRLQSSDEVVISDIDFPSGFTPWLALDAKPAIRLWNSRDGALEIDDLTPLLSPRTRLVQVSLVSFYNGWWLPWSDFVTAVKTAAPQAVISVDLTQALGRCVLDCAGADIMISSTHKWLLGTHGSCVIGVPSASAEKLTTAAGGWYHIPNAFSENRFEKLETKAGAASYAVGMPSFGPLYALNASMSYLLSVGIDTIARHADPLVAEVHAGLRERGIAPLAPLTKSGIVAFKHGSSERINAALRAQNVHIMHQAGRMRVAIHGYNTQNDVSRFFTILDQALKKS